MIPYRHLTPEDDRAIAALIRKNLEDAHLDIPGTAYFDPELDHLSAYYDAPGAEKRAYFVALDEAGAVVGGVGVAGYHGWDGCAELQKLYLTDTVKGKGYGRALMELAEDWARGAGYRKLYLETHSSLNAAIRLYEKRGYQAIPRPAETPHGTMDRFYCKDL